MFVYKKEKKQLMLLRGIKAKVKCAMNKVNC